MKKRILIFSVLALILSASARAYDFEVDGIYYNQLTSSTCEVTYKSVNYNSYSGDVSIPESVKYGGNTLSVIGIGTDCFKDCSGLKSVELPSSITSLGETSFRSCSGLKSITLPSSLKSLGRYCFYYCTSLTSITIPKNVTTVEYCCFKNCSSLVSITIEWNNLDNVYVGDDVFGGIASNPVLYVPQGTLSLYILTSPWSSFYNIVEDSDEPSGEYVVVIDGIRYFLDTNGNAIVIAQPTSLNGTIDVPSIVTYEGNDYSVCEIVSKAFSDCNISNLSLPNTIVSLPDYCFQDCTTLKSIDIPNSITSLPSDCFYGCTGLTSIDLPNSIISLGESCFQSCSGLKSITLPSNLKSLGRYCFYYCTSLTSITIPKNVTTVGYCCFKNCSSLDSITVEWSNLDNVYVGDDVFGGIASNPVLYVPQGTLLLYSLTSPWSSFYSIVEDDEEQSEEFVVVNGIRYYLSGDGEATIIAQSSDLSGAIDLPDVITYEDNDYFVSYILAKAFSDCNISSLSLPNTIVSLPDYCFQDCTTLKSIDLPNSITSLPSDCFYGCSGLTSIDLPNSIISLGESCFRNCSSLQSITLPYSLKTIGRYCFYYCTGFVDITSLNPEPPNCGGYVFENVPIVTCTLYVPDGSKDAYSTADQWQDFYSIIELEEDAIADIAANGNEGATGYYTTDGKKVSKPQSGINIIRYSNGTTKKVLAR